MRLGLYGGGFDPIHRGHIEPVRQARRELGLERVLYLPTARPPHKASHRFAPALARWAMVELALLSEEGLYASPFEMGLEEQSYTVDTLEHFRRQQPEVQWVYILGSDAFMQLDRWHRWRELYQLAELAVLARPGGTIDRQHLRPELRDALDSGRVRQVSNSEVALSSTEVRQRLTHGIDGLGEILPPLVLDYISKYDLYQTRSDEFPVQ